TTLTRGPIEIANAVRNKIADRAIAVASLLEAIEYALVPFADRLRRQLVNSADAINSAVISRSVDITQTIEEQRAIGKTPVWLAPEGINRPEIPLSHTPGRKLENNSASISATGSSRAIEVAMAQNHPSS